jgi:hypothetical protein
MPEISVHDKKHPIETMSKYWNLRNRNTMTHFNELSTQLNEHFQWNKARMDCLIGMVIALFFEGEHKLSEVGKGIS